MPDRSGELTKSLTRTLARHLVGKHVGHDRARNYNACSTFRKG